MQHIVNGLYHDKNDSYSKMGVKICGDKLKIRKSGANKRSRKDGIKCVKS